jgi:hypothetical protein
MKISSRMEVDVVVDLFACVNSIPLSRLSLAKSYQLHNAQLGWCGVGVQTVTVSFCMSLLQ